MRKLTKILRKHLAFILLFVLFVEIGLAALMYFFIPDRYEAAATLLISHTAEALSSENYELDSKLLATYRELCTNDKVLQSAISEAKVGLTPDQLRKRVRVDKPGASNFVSIRVWSDTPETAANLANALSEALIESVQSGLKIDNLQIVDAAKAPKSPARVYALQILAIGLGASFLLACLIVIMREYFDDTLRTADQVAELFGKPVIGQIPHGVTRLRRR